MGSGCRVVAGRTPNYVSSCGHCCAPSLPPHQLSQPSRSIPLQPDNKNYMFPQTWSKDPKSAFCYWEVTTYNGRFCCETELLTSPEVYFCFICQLLKYVGLLKMERFFQCRAQGRDKGPTMGMTRCLECERPYA